MKTSPNFQLITDFIVLHLLLIIMPLHFSCSLKNCLGIIFHCRCNSTKYLQVTQRMKQLGCESWQSSQANWALSAALVSSGSRPGCPSFLMSLRSGLGCSRSRVGVRGANNLEKAAWVLAHPRQFPDSFHYREPRSRKHIIRDPFGRQIQVAIILFHPSPSSPLEMVSHAGSTAPSTARTLLTNLELLQNIAYSFI